MDSLDAEAARRRIPELDHAVGDRFPLPVELPPTVDDGCDTAPPGLDDLFQRYAPYVATIGFRLLGHRRRSRCESTG